MRRDSIFYQLFQQLPLTLFDLLDVTPTNVSGYRFDSVEVKEASFRIDGVFLPPENDPPGIVYFCEVQFQKDEKLYERLFSESLLYFCLYRAHFSDWRVVIIYPSRKIEQSNWLPFQDFVQSPRVHRIYLEELTNSPELPLGLALMRLTILQEKEAPTVAREILARSQQEPESISCAIIELLTTILVYKFTHLSREEVEEMLGFTATELHKTRFYQEIKEEGERIGEQRGRQEGELTLILRLLTRRLGTVPEALRLRLENLSVLQLETLVDVLLDFQCFSDLQLWLDNLQKNNSSCT
ncbi:Rpn family recombination-promoting nuclease/putative transposase [Candidatus Synechococcus calcipolaris G9]|uniref:Rpn family recombination-promoting nuclease/putative transposase n=1 Tax=Candidatus Synechococcus calcipolaris G9 TaxID=1497997 RepID=A0ABT6EWY0_9SYNE|nr:Rpn family recombination-promoting nuclease/putative transposase [Candidatus Synechococcus calcipolaris]MDG2990297.1 Rpn family recombination-promoting nuclease/putative transposase [Candidatus Synechococcus calcipolaris G9]